MTSSDEEGWSVDFNNSESGTYSTVPVNIGAGAQSTLGAVHFCPVKIYVRKSYEFYMTFAEKLTKCPNFT